MYKIEEVYGYKRWWNFKAPKLNYYQLMKDGQYIGSSKNKKSLEDMMKNHIKYEAEPLYKVFKLGSGEFEILQKGVFRDDGLYYCPLFYRLDEVDNLMKQSERVFHKTLDEACKLLLKYEKLQLREIREPVDCV